MSKSDEPQQWITDYPQAQLIKALWMSCFQANAAIAVWKKPKSDTLYFLADFSSEPAKTRLELEGSLSGFAFSPFINPEGDQTLLLQADLTIRFEPDAQHLIINNQTPSDFWKKVWDTIQQNPKDCPPYYANADSQLAPANSREHFIHNVKKALDAINAGHFDKVVLARDLTKKTPQSFHLINLFYRLLAIQPNAFTSLVSIKNYGTWVGSSPEILVKTNNKGHFHTDSLAGTQAFSASKDLSSASWNQKEIEEQAMVSRYIIEQFKTLRLREFIETGPRSVRAGALIHLKTHYQVDMKAINHPTVATEMLHLLHPTSAVCGLPKESAMQFIQQHEALDRAFYSGYLGAVNIDDESNLYVNLRCMQVQKSQLVLYAGGGITHFSDPEMEWQETQLKCKTLLDVIDA